MTDLEYLSDWIRCCIRDLDEDDTESHIWFNRFLEMITELEKNIKSLNNGKQ